MKVYMSTDEGAKIILAPESEEEAAKIRDFQEHKNRKGGVLSLHPKDNGELHLVLTDLDWYFGQLRGR